MENHSLKVGIGRSDITPALGSHLSGYAAKDRVAETINDPLYSTSLVIESGETKVAIVSLDLCLVDEQDIQIIRRNIHDRTGIPLQNITICATHTHSGPMTFTMWGWGNKDEKYLNSAFPKITESVVTANQNLQDAQIGIGTTHSNVGINRREVVENHAVSLGFNPWGPYDSEMTVLKFQGKTSLIATLIHYGAHPTSLGARRFVSRDWPGIMVDRIESITKAPALFINGGEGDVAPRTNIHAVTGDGLPAAEEVGLRAASDALRAFNSIKELRDLKLKTLTKDITLPYSPLPELKLAKEELSKAEGDRNQWGMKEANYQYWKAVIEAYSCSPLTQRTFQQTITLLGPIAFVPFCRRTIFGNCIKTPQIKSFSIHFMCKSYKWVPWILCNP
jgi:neutral ceramidase